MKYTFYIEDMRNKISQKIAETEMSNDAKAEEFLDIKATEMQAKLFNEKDGGYVEHFANDTYYLYKDGECFCWTFVKEE